MCDPAEYKKYYEERHRTCGNKTGMSDRKPEELDATALLSSVDTTLSSKNFKGNPAKCVIFE